LCFLSADALRHKNSFKVQKEKRNSSNYHPLPLESSLFLALSIPPSRPFLTPGLLPPSSPHPAPSFPSTISPVTSLISPSPSPPISSVTSVASAVFMRMLLQHTHTHTRTNTHAHTHLHLRYSYANTHYSRRSACIRGYRERKKSVHV